MPALVLSRSNLGTVKKALSERYPNLKSSHLTEALAASLGFRTHAALLASIDQADPASPAIALLDDALFLSRLQEFGHRPSRDEKQTGVLDRLPRPETGLIKTTPSSAYDISYKSPRKRAWRNIMVSAINAGLEQKVFRLQPGHEIWAEKARGERYAIYRFRYEETIDGIAYAGDAGWDELSIHAALWPTGDFIRSSNAGFHAGEAFAAGWLERKEGFWLQTNVRSLRCRQHLLKLLQSEALQPLGYGDRGGIIL